MAASSTSSSFTSRLTGPPRSRGRREDISVNTRANPASSEGAPTSPDLVSFFGSQIGDQSVVNYSYTDDPARLLAWDIYNFFYYAWALPYILLPYKPTDSGALSELAPTRANLFCILIHFVLVILQLGFILIVPVLAFFMPLWTTILVVAGFLALNTAIISLLNGKDIIFHSNPRYAAPDQARFAHEQWVFLNGVAVGSHWMQSNLDRLALTFGRPIVGIHNRTSGIIFDVIECLVQRNLGYATRDIRMCYPILKAKLYDPRYSKVVFIMHSQGAIEGSMLLDWLLQELPQNLLSKLEMYTFGNAANHFNNPYRTVGSQATTEGRPLETGQAVGAVGLAPVGSAQSRSRAHQQTRDDRPPTPDSPPFPDAATTSNTTTTVHAEPQAVDTSIGGQSAASSSSSSVRAVRHIEHYAFTTDFVALWGVLHFATARPASNAVPRFLGRVFVRASPDDRGGHQLVQHYLDGMFPLAKDPETGAFVGAAERGNAFMESEVEIHDEEDEGLVGGRDGEEGAGVVCREGLRREGVARCSEATGASESDDSSEEEEVESGRRAVVAMHGGGGSPVVHRPGEMVGGRKVKQLSRLWKYRNGRSPVDKPPLLKRDQDGVVRGATL